MRIVRFALIAFLMISVVCVGLAQNLRSHRDGKSTSVASSCNCGPDAIPTNTVAHLTSYGKIKVRPVQLSSVRTKTFTWGDIHAGDCEMLPGATLVLRSDGTGTFDARVLTHHTHSGDTWHRTMDGQNGAGVKLFSLGNFDGPDHMNDDGTIYTWHRDFGYDNSKFDATTTMMAHDQC